MAPCQAARVGVAFGLSVPLPADGPPVPRAAQPLLASRASATRPSLAARIPGDDAPAVQTQAAECCRPPRPLPHTAMKDLLTSQKQACWQEHIRKETAARVAWNLSYGHKHPKEGALPRKRPQKAAFWSAFGARPSQATSSPDSKEVPAGRLETRELQDQLSRGVGVQGPAPKVDRGWQAQRATQGPADQTQPVGSGMRQVPPCTLQLLFQGISHDGQGRASYLRERYRQKPEEKFLYPIVSSWEYGWHMGKGHHPLAIPGLGRRAQPCPSSHSSGSLCSEQGSRFLTHWSFFCPLSAG